MSKAYEQSGVSLEAGYESVNRIKKHIAKTNRPGVFSGIDHLVLCLIYRHLITKTLS